MIDFLRYDVYRAEEGGGSGDKGGGGGGSDDGNYARIPKSDYEQLKKSADSLSNLRNAFPEKYRGKEEEFFKEHETLGSRLKELEDKDKSDVEKKDSRIQELETELESLRSGTTEEKTKLETLTSENESLKEQLHLVTMYGHVGRVQQLNNVYIPDEFINEEQLKKFDTSGYDLSDPKSQEKFTKDLWKTVLEPAHNKAQEAVKRMTGGRTNNANPDVSGNTNRQQPNQDNEPNRPISLTSLGQMA